jgi:hypothetical protein
VGAIPTIVVGTAEHTGKASTEWVLTLLHEHFHQWQYSIPNYYVRVGDLGLARGDTTGMWMLNYPFPYDSIPVQQAMKHLASALSAALGATPQTRQKRIAALVEARRKLANRLSPADDRYLEFQLWQEGVARFIEYKSAVLADSLGQPSPGFRALPDYASYSKTARRWQLTLRRELERFDLQRQRRVSFYPLGAAVAVLLDSTRPNWRQQYEAAPFMLSPLLTRQ